MTQSFYANLPATTDFATVADLSGYAPVPEDWIVLLTDVVASTQAIREGRYKEVNMVGAASIAAVLNALPDLTLPYVFGGDGAVLLVPPAAIEAGREALTGLAALARMRLDLELRVGVVPVAALYERGARLGVRKLELSPGNDLALFSGDGLELAEQLVKDPSPGNPFVTEVPAAPPLPDLEGLSCRWEPLQAAHGVNLTLMLRAVSPEADAQARVLREALQTIQEILREDPARAAPARPETTRVRWPPSSAWIEAKTTAKPGRTWLDLLKIWLIWLVFIVGKHFGMKMGSVNLPRYLEEMRANTDFRKYDGLLRLVLDVSPAQAEAIEEYLKREYTAGRIIYGTHRADAALMTCLVFSMAQSQHIHFIDGADGGFALAAQDFKKRRAAVAEPASE